MQYRQLLLSEGGGVIHNIHKAPQDTCATIAIGLGGTGISCLRNLKRQVYSRVQPDDPKAVIPTYSHIKFLAVDTDRKSMESDGQIYDLNEATEFFDISSENIQSLLQQTAVLAGKPECGWLKNKDDEQGQGGLSILCATAGAGGVRQIGRLLMVEKSRAFVDRVCQLIRETTEGSPGGSSVIIHIFTGMGGGTGSGSFLDVCYLVRQAIQEAGESGRVQILGYLFTPDVNLSVHEIAAQPAISNQIKANGFAAMKELDYCMSFQENHGSWDQEYQGFHVGPTQLPPVDCCYLVSGCTVNGTMFCDEFSNAMDVVAEWVIAFITQRGLGNFHTPLLHTFQIITRGTYHILGASSVVVPNREITTYLASKLFEGMAKVRKQTPTDSEIEAFARANGLTFQDLFRSILDKTSYRMPTLQLDYRMYTSMPEDDLDLPDEVHLPESILGSYRQVELKMMGRVEINKQALLHEWRKENIKEDQDSVSKMCRVYHALADIVVDANKGPMYAAAVLEGFGRRDLVDLLKGVLAETQDTISKAEMNKGLRISTLKNARTAFLHPRLFQNRNRLFEEFLDTVQEYMTLICMMKVLEEMESMVRTMIDHMDRLYEDYFKHYAYVTQNLIDTFHENYRYLTARKESVENPFVMPLVTIEEMKDSLDNTVASMNLDSELSAFHANLFAMHDVWLEGDEDKICKAVSSYFTDRFSAYTNKTLTDYLEICLNTIHPGILSDRIYHNILMPLSDKATPLFSLSSAFEITDAAPLGYCFIPDDAIAIRSAASTLLAARQDLSLVPNKVPDRISVLRSICGIPLYAYADIGQCYDAYRYCGVWTGIHIYEGTAADPRDWRKLPNPLPAFMQD